ncbi:MAG: patatin-like phospholipase family protein [bacterium]
MENSVQKVTGFLKQIFGGPQKVGLVLGGGGARGVAHIGVIKVLAENKIPIYCITGTSSGAIFGALFSGGMNPHDMAKQARHADWMKLVKFKLSKTGPVSGEGIEKLITGNISCKNIEDLAIPLNIVATDLKTGERVVIDHGNIAKAVHASAAIPGVFSPVQFQGRLLADGLVVDNVPVEAARDMGADFIIAIDVIPNVILGGWLPNVLNVIERSMDINCRRTSETVKRTADIVIEPVNRNISALSLNEVDELIKMGENAAKDAIPQIKAKLKIPG